MKFTDIFKFKLFERTDQVDMETVNENFKSVEKLFKGLDQVDNTADCDKNVASAKKAECDGNGKNISETYLKKAAVANNNITTESGFALDARQANPNVDGSLAKQINTLNDGLKNYLPLSGGKITASIFGSSGGQFAVDGNVYIKGNGYDGWLTDYLNLRPKVVFEGIVHENTNAILETNSMYLLFSMTDISGEQHNPYVAFIYTGKTHINRLDIVGGTGGWALLPTNGGTIQGLYPVNGAYNHVVIVKLYPL